MLSLIWSNVPTWRLNLENRTKADKRQSAGLHYWTLPFLARRVTWYFPGWQEETKALRGSGWRIFRFCITVLPSLTLAQTVHHLKKLTFLMCFDSMWKWEVRDCKWMSRTSICHVSWVSFFPAVVTQMYFPLDSSFPPHSGWTSPNLTGLLSAHGTISACLPRRRRIICFWD